MKYMGSKAKYAKYILPIILKDRKEGQWYVEPFVGGANMMDKVDGNRMAFDNNRWLIATWKGLIEKEKQPIINKASYDLARLQFRGLKESHFSLFEVGYIGWMGSFNGRFFDGGYSGQTETRDYVAEQIKNTIHQIEKLENVVFECTHYSDIIIPTNSIIYCDPPYKGTKQYCTSKDFCYHTFFEWCREQKSKGHSIFISEYSAPDDFKCVWEMQVTNSMNTTKTYKPTERLFTI